VKKRQAKKILKLKDKLSYRETLIKQAEVKMSAPKSDGAKADADKDREDKKV
jgi:hypothetical protein